MPEGYSDELLFNNLFDKITGVLIVIGILATFAITLLAMPICAIILFGDGCCPL